MNSKKSTIDIIFRVDASKHIGMGHLIRCVKLAYHLSQKDNLKILFISFLDKTAQEYVAQNGIRHVLLTSPKNLPEIKQILASLRPRLLINDVWDNRSKKYLEVLKQFSTKLVTLDDNHYGWQYSDILINSLPAAFLSDTHTNKGQIYQGLKYMIISGLDRGQSTNISGDILISLGGTDMRNLCLKIALELNQLLPAKKITAVTTSTNYISLSPSIQIIKPFTIPMVNLFYSHPTLITSGGITLFEGAIFKKRILAYACQPWEKRNIQYIANLTSAYYIGNYKNTPAFLAQNCAKYLNFPISTKSIVDENGIQRVSALISSLWKS